jgi:anthranilate synthase component 1
MPLQKPNYTQIAEDLDFFELFKIIEKNFKNCYLIESLGQESNERYSVIGFDPQKIFRSNAIDTLEVLSNNSTQQIETKNAYYKLRDEVPQNVISRNYSGGLFGFMSYEGYNFFQNKINLKPHPDFELFKFGLYQDGLVYDKTTGQVFYFCYESDRSQIIKSFIDELKNNSGLTKKKLSLKVKFLGHTLTQKEHQKKVIDTIEEIKAGNSFQAEVGFKSEYEIEGDKILIYEKLRQVNPSPFMYYCKFGEQIIIGASPELLIRLNQGELQTSPLAGTTKRGKTIEEDLILARKLLNDTKEKAEHNMLVDMHRNDVGTIARFGTVKVRNLMEIKRFSHVQHISSDVVGIINPQKDMFDALAALMPGGVVSGAPKIETAKIISRNEPQPRGVYGGAIGHFGLNGNCTFAIPIRTVFIKGKKAFAQTSSGIVYDSNPEYEYQEILNKLEAMKKVLAEFEI